MHSCYDAMVSKLNEVGFDRNNENHKIIFLGDAFDKGDKPVETYLFFKGLLEDNKMIWIKGNHDVEFINSMKNKKYSKAGRDTALKIAKYYDNTINEETDVTYVFNVLINNNVLDLLENKTVDYYELNDYVFTHGFIPTIKNHYLETWRETPSDKWNSVMVRSCNGIKMVLVNHIKVPNKTLVCGHVGSYFGKLVKDHPNLDVKSKEFDSLKRKYSKDFNNYHTFYGDGVINLDGNCYKTGIFNILLVEE